MKGSCLCGSVKYEITSPPLKTILCHCLECRKVSGTSNSINVMIPKSAFTYTGDLKDYSFTQEIGDQFAVHFCPTCGSSIYKDTTREDMNTVLVVEGGSLDKEAFAELKPGAEFFTKHRALWLDALPGAAQIEEAPSRAGDA